MNLTRNELKRVSFLNKKIAMLRRKMAEVLWGQSTGRVSNRRKKRALAV